VICRTTDIGFDAGARVTEDRWIACAVSDGLGMLIHMPKEDQLFAARKIDIMPAPRASTVKTPTKNSSPNNPAIQPQERANSPIAIDSRTFALMAL
jgi:hypothetical protein